MAKSGGQPGNKNGTKGVPWSDALRKAIIQGKRLDTIAKKVIQMAEDGDMQAIKEIGDRLEGKAKQIIAGDSEAPLVIHAVDYTPKKD